MKNILAVVLVMSLSLFTACPSQTNTQKLATASDSVAHALVNAQTAVSQGVQDGVISPSDAQAFNNMLANVSQAGLALDKGIRANEAATTLSGKVNAFLDAFNNLQNTGVLGIKDPHLRLAISTIITGAESSFAIIAATVGK
jgi:hypothetical protein